MNPSRPRIVSALLLATGAGLAGADVPQPDPAAEIRVAIDVDAVGSAARDAFPTSLWYDPAEGATVAHVLDQIDLLLGGGDLKSAKAVAGLHGVSAVIHAPAANDPDAQQARWAFAARHDDAAGLAAALAPRLPLPLDGAGAPATVDLAGYHGTSQWHWFCGSATAAAPGPGLLMAGDRLAVQSWGAGSATPPAVAPPAAPVWMTVDLAPTLAVVRALAGDGISFGLDPLLPRWHSDPAALALGLTPAEGGWNGSIAFAAPALPLHAIDPSVAALGRKRQVRLALGIDPRALTGLIANQLTVAEERDFGAMIGAPAEDAAAVFTGDVIVLADVDGLLPQGAAVFGVRPGRSPAGVVAALVKTFHGEAVPNTTNVWQLETPLGPLGIAYNDQRVVVGNDPTLGADLLAGTPGDAPIPAGRAVCADADLPAIAKLWLPLAWRWLQERRIPLAPEPIPALAFRLPESALALAQTRGKAAKLAQLLDDNLPPLVLTHDGGALPWKVETGYLRFHLRHLMPAGDLADDLEHGIALYAAAPVGAPAGAPPTIPATVLRLADGWHVMEDDRKGRPAALNDVALAARLHGLDHLLGPEAAQLPVLTPAGIPVFDRTWLPELGRILPKLKPWHLEGTVDADGGKAVETGEPLATLALAFACASMALNDLPHLLHYHLRAVEERDKPPPEQAPPPEPGRVEL
jgi:hypothetical protein